MSDKVKDEEEALAICREKAAQRGLAMSIVDAEYQWQVVLVSVQQHANNLGIDAS